ncbi:hypothetical protein N8I77_000248 [Diaporthe amygdali]|uniref:Zn(2)-C6 fungal-type domain-containing protein n=1 Tax=Phomopsis amygdali TaxID=1214568 RepID=A0AAD9SPM0_PHOAM|nr:hypothetical protein N8I77_000248 [Diaporthe amygdali]
MPDSTPASGDHSRATPEVQKYRPRACQSCARSKMRCVWPSEPGATPCQRCSKIKAPCTLPEINPRRRRGPSTRVGQLEEKIDGIMSLLNASQQIQQNSPSSSGHTPPSSASVPVPSHEPGRNSIQQLLNPNIESASSAVPSNRPDLPEPASSPPSTQNYHYNARPLPPPGMAQPGSIATGPTTEGNSPKMPPDAAGPGFRAQQSRPSPPGNESVEIIPGFRMTFYEAERALNIYRSLYAPYFPFITIPVMATAYDLYEKTPFLFRTIVSVAAPQSPTTQADYKVWFRHYIAEHVVINNERRLEILQALLVHMAWGDFHFFIDSQATNFIQLAVALVIDLGLNRWPLDFGKASFLLIKDAASHTGIKKFWNKTHTLDEMRAALGTFYVTSLLSALFRRHNPMTYSSYLTKCCDEIEQAREYDSDSFLVTLVKIQQLLGRAAEIIPHGDDEASRRVNYAPIHMALTVIRKELDALVRQQPPEVECNSLLWTHYHGTICRLYEPVIYIRSTSAATGYDAGDANSRTSALWACLGSARDFFSAFMAIPPQNLVCMPFQSAHFSFAIVTASRLLFLGDEAASANNPRDPDWVVSVARDHLNFDGVCARLAEFFDEADRLATGLGRRGRYVDGERSVLGMFKDKVRWIRSWYLGRARPGTSEGYPASYPHDPRFRREAVGDVAKDGVSGGGGVGTTEAGASNATAQAGAGGGQAMDVDYGAPSQLPMPGELDETFWQAMFDMNGSGVDWMEVQT